jgi:hypothetical protein
MSKAGEPIVVLACYFILATAQAVRRRRVVDADGVCSEHHQQLRSSKVAKRLSAWFDSFVGAHVDQEKCPDNRGVHSRVSHLKMAHLCPSFRMNGTN